MQRTVQRWGTAFFVLVLAGVLVGGAAGAAGDLDQTFGGAGLVVTDLGGFDAATAVATEPGGRIVVAGSTDAGGGSTDFGVARYRPDGSLDPGFGNAGIVQTDFAGGFDRATAVALQNGKIVALGMEDLGNFGLVRYKPNGSLDGSFGNGGKVTTNFGAFSTPGAMALQHGGKIVAAGVRESLAGGMLTEGFAVARYKRDGDLDASFGTGGKAVVDLGPGLFPEVTGVLILPSGEIVVGGGSTFGGGINIYKFTLAMLLPDGTLDPSFGNGGIVTTTFGPAFPSSGVEGLALQGGKIVAGGFAQDPATGDTDFALARYDLAGNLDPSFGVGGKVLTSFAGPAFMGGLVLDGQLIVAAGYAGTYPAYDFALARYQPDGSLDSNFGLNGEVLTDFGGTDFGLGVALDSSGIVVAGQTNANGSNDFALARYER